jgi:kynurenine formamidase
MASERRARQRGTPVYEQVFNVKRLVDKERLFFVGVALNIPDGDGMIVMADRILLLRVRF